jgi:hypothetical protein
MWSSYTIDKFLKRFSSIIAASATHFGWCGCSGFGIMDFVKLELVLWKGSER